MPRVVTAEDLRARLGRELDALRASEEALYVSSRVSTLHAGADLTSANLVHDVRAALRG